MKRSWNEAFDSNEATEVHHPALEPRSKPPQPRRFETDTQMQTDSAASNKPCLHRCASCHINFLSAQGLTQHMNQAHSTSTTSDLQPSTQEQASSSSTTTRGRPRMPSSGPIPGPMTVFTYPLCQEKVGRKAVAAHLRTIHQFERPNEFEFKLHRDVIPGRLSCAHCKATFSVEFALRTHFKKASCPVRLCQLASDLHFGPMKIPILHLITLCRPILSTSTRSHAVQHPSFMI